MKVKSVSVAVLASLAAAAPSLRRRGIDPAIAPLTVTLEVTDATHVTALISNKGSEALTLSKAGTFLDDSPMIERVAVFQTGSGQPVDYIGLHDPMGFENLTVSDFHVLPAGESIKTSFDVAAAYQLTEGTFNVASEGVIPYAKQDSTTIDGGFYYSSNNVTITVNSAQAAQFNHGQKLAARSSLSRTCLADPHVYEIVRKSLDFCVHASLMAMNYVNRQHVLFQDYFKFADDRTKAAVKTIYHDIALECVSDIRGRLRITCNEDMNRCPPGMLAYQDAGTNDVSLCPPFFAPDFFYVPNICFRKGRATTLIYEMTHHPAFGAAIDYPGLRNGINTFSYKFIHQTSPAEALKHASNYEWFAQMAAVETMSYVVAHGDERRIIKCDLDA